VPWRDRFLPGLKDQQGEHDDFEKDPNAPMVLLESAMKISHTSPDIQLEAQTKATELNHIHIARVQRQVTEPTSSVRHNSIRRQMNVSNPDFNLAQFQRQESISGPGLGRIKPELYKQRSVDTDDGRRADSCGRLHFILKYDCDLEQLIVKIHKAQDLPAKDFTGTSDPYVKIYLLPDRKTKLLVSTLDLEIHFPVEFSSNPKINTPEQANQGLQDHYKVAGRCLIQVRANLCRKVDLKDNVDLGDLMFSLCYLPTAGRLTITIIKARNLKAMDITGASDPYVKVSLMCDGRRLKKRKTSTKRNTLNPVYNEAIVFDVPPENIDQISLLIAVMDYDRIGHNEVIGVCHVGNRAQSLGRDHWNEMLTYPRKPIARWHLLVEVLFALNPILFEFYI
uniref:Synaptotagmin IXb n=1 Tax=Sinocyclocheilus grahami TaxID=75366 RepID=A0A672QER8_SINGR